jgi:hypothetical protein
VRVNEQLLLISVQASEANNPKPGAEFPEYGSHVVSQQDNRIAYNTVNVYRDWLAEHIGYFREHPTDKAPQQSLLCTHENGCDTLAGFYRAIATGGDAYLNVDNVYDDMHDDYIPNAFDDLKDSLATLKAKAAGYVKELVDSTLQLRSRDELEYLTCVKVEQADVPWLIEEDVDSDEDMDVVSD